MNQAEKEQYLREYNVLKSQGKPFFPYAVGKDAAMAVVVMIVIITMSIVLGAELGPKADPTTTTYVPRPEWYFFFLFEVLRVIKPPLLTPLATIGVPTICMALLFLLPFYDRGPERRPERRPIGTIAGIFTICAMGYLTYAGGYWYGIGEGGPFRSDGFGAEFLGLPRERGWGKTTNLSYAWAIYHPDRNVVLFGLNQTPVPSGRSATYPTVVWIWDCQRERWISDIAMSADMTYASAIPSVTTTFSPSTAPTSLAFTHFSAGLTTVAATWTNGDATASTEIWVRDINSGGTSALWSTAAPAATSARRTPSRSRLSMRVRHAGSGRSVSSSRVGRHRTPSCTRSISSAPRSRTP